MQYYCFNKKSEHTDAKSNTVVVMSEEEIIAEFYDRWYDAMVSKFGQEAVDAGYCKDDCIDDWCIINVAWESTDE